MASRRLADAGGAAGRIAGVTLQPARRRFVSTYGTWFERSTMLKLILAALALAVPTAALAAGEAPSPIDLAKAACKSEKAQLDKNTFMLAYPASSASTAMNACVDKRDGPAATDLKNAAKACKAERAANPAAFTKKYGTNKNGKNAYGKCVSTKARHATGQETQARVNAAKTCKKLKAEQKATFEAAYGTQKNAFAKCVGKTAKAP
jgi:hypothetical protein